MQLPWIKRSDLIAIPHDAGGWVVKDPLTLNYAHLNDAEYGVLDLLNGKANFPALLQGVQKMFPDQQLGADDIGAFIGQLAGHQLIRRTNAGDSARLNPETQPSMAASLLRHLMSVLRFHLPLVNPSRFLDWAMPTVSRLFSKSAATLFSVVGCAAILIVLMRLGELKTALPSLSEFLGASNLFLMLAVFVVVKVLHEAGHAFTARYFGAECNECGLMLMVFTPVMYTNVSDAWLLPKRQRLLVTAAGILVELSIASVATVLWWNAAPGITKSLLLNTMLICSFNTVLFNGNPLLRFDGYFLLTDWVGIPNLASRAGALLQETILSLVTGCKTDSVEPHETRRFLLLYGVLSAAYRLFLTLAILQLVQQVSREWHVEFIGTLLSTVMLVGFLVFPLVRFLSRLMFIVMSENTDGIAWNRSLISIGCVLLLWLLPVPHSVIAPGLVQPNGAAVYAVLPGRIKPAVSYGEQVKQGDIIAELVNPELHQTKQRLESRVTDLQLQIESLQNSPLTVNSALLPILQQSLQSATTQLDEFEVEFAGLQIRSPADGVFQPPMATVPEDRDELPERWAGTPVRISNSGAWIDRGVLLGHAGELSEVKLLVCIDESEVELLKAEQSVEFLPLGGQQVLRGTVSEVSQLAATEVPVQLGVAGLVNGRATESGFSLATVSYLVTVHFDDSRTARTPALYSAGHTRIHTRSLSLLSRLTRYLRRTFG